MDFVLFAGLTPALIHKREESAEMSLVLPDGISLLLLTNLLGHFSTTPFRDRMR